MKNTFAHGAGRMSAIGLPVILGLVALALAFILTGCPNPSGGGSDSDKTALASAITAAETNIGSVEVSADGKDVDPVKQWVTAAVKTDYQTAIDAAKGVNDNADAAQDQVDEAVSALATATTAFNAAKKNGTKTQTGSHGFTHTYWVDDPADSGQGHIAFGGGAAAAITNAAGQSVTINAAGEGYTGQHWYIKGTEDRAKIGQTSYTFNGEGKAAGVYVITLRVAKDGKYYSADFTVTVTAAE